MGYEQVLIGEVICAGMGLKCVFVTNPKERLAGDIPTLWGRLATCTKCSVGSDLSGRETGIPRYKQFYTALHATDFAIFTPCNLGPSNPYPSLLPAPPLKASLLLPCWRKEER